MTRHIHSIRFCAYAALAGSFVALATGCDKGSKETPDTSTQAPPTPERKPGAVSMTKPNDQAERSASVQNRVVKEATRNADERRKAISQEAATALAETRAAFEALVRKQSEKALASLEIATGKLELILSRDPSLELAPTDVNVGFTDLLVNLDDINTAKEQADDLLADGRVQDARFVLADLASEAVISTTNVPLNTYPAAIKRAARFVDEGKLNDAGAELESALATVVVTKVALPLPILRARYLLDEAAQLAAKSGRAQAENTSLSSLLDNTRYQLKMGEALGYGSESDFNDMYARLDELRDKTREGKVLTGVVDKIKERLTALNKHPSR